MNYEEIFAKNLASLNENQRAAVEQKQIDGPLLVIAGPGTGKTKLLSTRIAKILHDTGADASNILAMTFTDAGAENMRERLTQIVGATTAYHVEISTYHAFANKIFRAHKDLLGDASERQINELDAFMLAEQIFAKFPSNARLKTGADKQAKNIAATVADLKKNNISAETLRKISAQNKLVAEQVNAKLSGVDFAIFSNSKADATDAKLREMANIFNVFDDIKIARVSEKIPTLAEILRDQLGEIVARAQTKTLEEKPRGIFTEFGKFRTHVFQKDDENGWILNKDFSNSQLAEIADFYENYDDEKRAKKLYDYDDMLARAIKILEENDNLRYTLAERFQYILLDEYQDTNKAQARLVELLTGATERPNIMAVGDDDQGIMAFQGAEISNMRDFRERFKPREIALSLNYRSAPEIIEFAQNIIENLAPSERIVPNKKLVAGGKNAQFSAEISRDLFPEQAAEFTFVARKIRALLDAKIDANEIAIIAPKHTLLQEISRYLAREKVAVEYSASENILDEKVLRELFAILKLADALADPMKFGDAIDALWPEVLAQKYWEISPTSVFKLSQKMKKIREKERRNPAENRTEWIDEMLKNDDENLHKTAEFFAALAVENANHDAIEMINLAIGRAKIGERESPFLRAMKRDENLYFNFATWLKILAAKLADFRPDSPELKLRDLLEMVDLYRAAELKIPNTNPYRTGEKSVHLMTAHHAKGLEFSHVFLIAVDNEDWNSTRENAKIALPENLKFVRAPHDESECLRLFFVAITRAKDELFLTASRKNIDGKARKPLAFLDENWSEDEANFARAIPQKFSEIHEHSGAKISVDELETAWQDFYMPEQISPRELLAETVKNFKISPSALTSYYDLTYDGPREFYENYVLGFPNGSNSNANFGTVMHAVFDHFEKNFARSENADFREIFDAEKMAKYAENELRQSRISEENLALEVGRARDVFTNFIVHRGEILARENVSEKWIGDVVFSAQNIILNGKIDRIEIDREHKILEIVDWKTGKITREQSFPKRNKKGEWSGEPKLWRYEIQLYFYKILVDYALENFAEFRHDLGIGSDFREWKISRGRLEFIEGKRDVNEPEPIARIVEFNDEKMQNVRAMIENLHAHLVALDFANIRPDKNFGVKEIVAFIESEVAQNEASRD